MSISATPINRADSVRPQRLGFCAFNFAAAGPRAKNYENDACRVEGSALVDTTFTEAEAEG
jgi:hypothetical protein